MSTTEYTAKSAWRQMIWPTARARRLSRFGVVFNTTKSPWLAADVSSERAAADDASDLDLLVVLRDDRLPATHREKEDTFLSVARLLRDIRRKAPVDLIVHTQPMHRKFIEMNSLFARQVLEEGIVLYEADNA